MQTILFFDLDATLVENHFSRKVFSPLLQEIEAATGISSRELWFSIDRENLRRQKEDPDNVLTMDWDDLMRSLAESHGVRLSDSLDNRWQSLANLADIEILDESPKVLASLRNEQRKLVLATKGLYKYQEPILALTGLDKVFDDILTPDRTGYLKTSPQYFEKYQQVEARRIQVGDHYYDDVICAKRNGFYSIMRAPLEELSDLSPFERPLYLAELSEKISTYPKGGTKIRPDAVVVSLEELPELLTEIEKR